MKSKFTLLCLLVLSTNVLAQTSDNIRVNAGLSIATSKFGEVDLDDERAGYAGTGLTVGIEKLFPMSKEGLFIYGGANIIVNPFSREAKDAWEDDNSGYDIKFPIYVQAPVQGGIEYQIKGNESFNIYFKGGLNLDFLKLTNIKFTRSNYSETQEFKISTTLGAQIGMGLILKKGTKIGLNYLPLGQHRIRGDVSYNDGTKDNLDVYKVRVTLVNFYVSMPISNK